MLKSLLPILFVLSLKCLSAREGLVHADDYQKNSSLQWKWAMESLEVFPLAADDKVLDLGCGTGSVTAEIAAKVPLGTVVALDISETMLSYARDHYPASNLIYMQADARKLPFVEQFDKVIALLSLNWIKEQEEALHSVYTALKPGGKAIITRPGKQPSNLGPMAQRLVESDTWTSHFPHFQQTKQYYSAEEYRVLLENAGFSIEKISEDSTYTYFKDREALTGFFRPLCTFTHHLPLDLQEQFVKELIDLVLELDRPLTNGSILLHDFKLEAIVSKPN